MNTSNIYDAIVIGGGFYGSVIAISLAKEFNFKKVALLEKESSLLKHASYNNQARVHNGYHYPRSFTTAFRSRINLPLFIKDWPQAIRSDFAKLYAIPKRNSKVTPKQFERFCLEIGAKLESAPPSINNLFDDRLIEKVYVVEEYAFDTLELADWAVLELEKSNVHVILDRKVTAISVIQDGLKVTAFGADADPVELKSTYVFNCTYSGINHIHGDFKGISMGVKQEITEMALVELPTSLKNLGITVMDGPFFSIMPFPARNLHTVSHVRYTPHCSWQDNDSQNPYELLDAYDKRSRFDRMQRDIARYIPSIIEAKQKDSLFEVKTLLAKNETDDGRPILFEKHTNVPGCFSILGGKIDNIYDILEKLKSEIYNQN